MHLSDRVQKFCSFHDYSNLDYSHSIKCIRSKFCIWSVRLLATWLLIIQILSENWFFIIISDISEFSIHVSQRLIDKLTQTSEFVQIDFFYKCRMLRFFENLKTSYFSNFSKESSHYKISSRLSNAETQLKRYEISYSFLLALNVCMFSEHSHAYSNRRIFYLDGQIFS